MALDLAAVKTELTTDPLARGYAGMDDETAANRLAVVDRPADGPVSAMLNYLLINKQRSNTGTDTTNTSMLGRLIIASQTTIGSDPFGATPTTPMTLDSKCSALALLEIVRNPGISRLAFQTTALQQILTDMVNINVMKASDKTAIIALSNNLRSRASELFGQSVTTSDVANARRLP